MQIKGDAFSTTHRCDSCNETFVICDEKQKGSKDRFLVIDRSKFITNGEDFNHYANGLSYCANCSKVIYRVLNLKLPNLRGL